MSAQTSLTAHPASPVLPNIPVRPPTTTPPPVPAPTAAPVAVGGRHRLRRKRVKA